MPKYTILTRDALKYLKPRMHIKPYADMELGMHIKPNADMELKEHTKLKAHMKSKLKTDGRSCRFPWRRQQLRCQPAS